MEVKNALRVSRLLSLWKGRTRSRNSKGPACSRSGANCSSCAGVSEELPIICAARALSVVETCPTEEVSVELLAGRATNSVRIAKAVAFSFELFPAIAPKAATRKIADVVDWEASFVNWSLKRSALIARATEIASARDSGLSLASSC